MTRFSSMLSMAWLRRRLIIRICLILGWAVFALDPATRFLAYGMTMASEEAPSDRNEENQVLRARAMLEAIATLEEEVPGTGKWKRSWMPEGAWVQKDDRKIFVPVVTKAWGYPPIFMQPAQYRTSGDLPVVMIGFDNYDSCEKVVDMIRRDFPKLSFGFTKIASVEDGDRWVPFTGSRQERTSSEVCRTAEAEKGSYAGFRLMKMPVDTLKQP